MHHTRFTLLCLLIGVMAIGCSKKTPVVSASDAPAAPAADQPASAPAAQPSAAIAVDANADARLAAVRAAMKAKDYDKASAALFVPIKQQTAVPMTGQQLMTLNEAKAAYMNQLFAAAAAGDQKAKAALDNLRQNQNR